MVVAFAMRFVSLCLALALVACGRTSSEAPAPSSPASAPSEAPSTVAAATAPEPAPTANTAAPEPSAAPEASAAPAESAVPEAAPLPEVDVKNIGMHIGGGPNDAVSKKPIADSVKPHFDELRRCYAKAEDQTKGGDFGIDLLIPHEGGKAQSSHPRSVLKGAEFRDCVVGVFDAIEFLKPKTGKTMVSYSLRFTPKDAK